jgi:hypothetical protein
MDYKNKIEELIKDMNVLCADGYLFPDKTFGFFELKINDQNKIGVVLDLVYKEDDLIYVVLHKTISFYDGVDEDRKKEEINYFYRISYFELLRNSLLLKDSIDLFKDSPGNNVLSFQTLLASGLEKIRNLKR